MTKALVFTNPGEIDIRGATIAGLSAKETDTAIGYFGTGLKYAIAQILANGGSIKIWSGLSCYDFHAKELEFRGQTHSQIVMDFTEAGITGDVASDTQPLGFTTHYGRKWKAWQIFRELYANALDEGGDVSQLGTYPLFPAPGLTAIIVTGWEEFQDEWFNRDEIILPPAAYFEANSTALSVANVSSAYIYYKGVRVAARRCELLWNFKTGLTLTEDRTVEGSGWDVSNKVNSFIVACDNETIIRKVLCAGKQTFEAGCLGWFNPPKRTADCTKAFASVAADLYRSDPVKYREYEELALDFVPELKAARLVSLTPLQTRMLDKAKELVSRMGYEYEVSHLPITVENLGGKTLGRFKDGAISISPLVFDQGTKALVSTLYEECLHAKLGYSDCTYEMQTHLFNTIVGLFEEQWGEPC